MNKVLLNDAMRVLKNTSRTFYIPITFLNKDLKHAVAVAYLAMRAIDEIEDHENISNEDKHKYLWATAELLKADSFDGTAYADVISPIASILPEVSVR